MFRIDPDTLYGLAELEKLLEGIVALPTLLERLGLREKRVFRGALWGWEILEAARRAGPFAGGDALQLTAAAKLVRQSGASRGRKPASHLSPVRRLRAEDLAP